VELDTWPSSDVAALAFDRGDRAGATFSSCDKARGVRGGVFFSRDSGAASKVSLLSSLIEREESTFSCNGGDEGLVMCGECREEVGLEKWAAATELRVTLEVGND